MRLTSFRILLLLTLPILVLTSFIGIKPTEEGYVLNSSENFLNGLMPYRDFEFAYTPLSIFLTSLSFQILGNSILSSRILVFILSLVSTILFFKIIVLSTRNKQYAFFASLLFVLLSSPIISHASPVIFGTFSSLLVLYLLLKFLETRKQIFLFPAGFLSFTVFLAHQGFGLSILLSVIFFFTVKNSRSILYVTKFSYGYIWGIISFLIYLLATNTFAEFMREIFEFNFYSPSISYLTPHLQVGNALLPFIATLHLITFVILIYRRRFHLLFLQIFSTLLLILNFSFVSMISFALIGLSLSLAIRYSVSTNARILFYLSLLFIIAYGFINLHARYSSFHNFGFSKNPKIGILIEKKEKQKIEDLATILDYSVKNHEEIFIISDETLLYYILDLKSPPFSNNGSLLLAGAESTDRIIGNMVAKNAKVVVVDRSTYLDVKLKKYLAQYYAPERNYNNFDILLRKP